MAKGFDIAKPPKRKRDAMEEMFFGLEESAKRRRARAKLHLKATKTEALDSTSALLRLPTELLNRIYDASLVEDDPIIVTSILKEPALLSTCRQVRKEAKSIWYMENEFQSIVIDCDDSLLAKWTRHLRKINFDPPETIAIVGQIDWPMLVKWCSHVWYHQSMSPSYGEQHVVESQTVVIAAHDITAAHARLPWAVCERSLKNLEDVVRKLDPSLSLP